MFVDVVPHPNHPARSERSLRPQRDRVRIDDPSLRRLQNGLEKAAEATERFRKPGRRLSLKDRDQVARRLEALESRLDSRSASTTNEESGPRERARIQSLVAHLVSNLRFAIHSEGEGAALLVERYQGLVPKLERLAADLEVTYRTPGGGRLRLVAQRHYRPDTSTRPVSTHDRSLDSFLASRVRGGSAGARQVLDNTWSVPFDRRLKGYLRELEKKKDSEGAPLWDYLGLEGARPFDSLTPWQATELSVQVAVDTLRYGERRTNALFGQGALLMGFLVGLSVGDLLGAALHVGGLGWLLGTLGIACVRVSWIDQLGAGGYFRKSQGRGECSDFSALSAAVFDGLRRMQDPTRTQLANSTVELVTSKRHEWLAVYTVQRDGEVWVTHADPTHARLAVRYRARSCDPTFEKGRDAKRHKALKRALRSTRAG